MARPSRAQVEAFYERDSAGLLKAIPGEDGGFNYTLPISRSNEGAALTALNDSIASLSSWCAARPLRARARGRARAATGGASNPLATKS